MVIRKGIFFAGILISRMYTGYKYSNICWWFLFGGESMGVLYVRMGPGNYVSTQASDRTVVYLFNSGIKIWTIGPTTEEESETGARGTLESSTERYPLPSPPI